MTQLNQLTSSCSSESPLTTNQIYQFQQFIQLYPNSRQDLFNLIENSVCFWQNCYLLISENTKWPIKLQVILLIQRRVKNNWVYQNDTIKGSAKQFLCRQAQDYHFYSGSDGLAKSYFRIINKVIAEILKHQWTGDWATFLFAICQAIMQNQNYAENYFDMLRIIFQVVFTDDSKLTFEQQKKLGSLALKHQKAIQKCFQQYLIPSSAPNILKNCAEAMQSLLQWLPVYNTYTGSYIECLIQVVDKDCCRIEVIKCLLVILNKQITSCFCLSTQLYLSSKQKILVPVLQTSLKYPDSFLPSLLPQILTSCFYFLRQKQQYMKILQTPLKNKYRYLQSQVLNTDDKPLLRLIVSVLFFYVPKFHSGECTDFIDFVDLLAYVQPVFRVSEGIFQDLVKIVVLMTPCHFRFSGKKGIFDEQEDQEDKIEKFVNMMGTLISKQSKVYVEYLKKMLQQINVLEVNQQTIQKISWNMYHYITASQVPQFHLNNFQKAMIKALLNLQSKIQNHQNRAQNEKVQQHLLKLYQTNKISICLILSHPRNIICDDLFNPFKAYFLSIFSARIVFQVTLVIKVLGLSYAQIRGNERQIFHGTYLHQMEGVDCRVGLDLVYCGVVAKQVSKGQKTGRLDEEMEYIRKIMNIHKQKLKQVLRKNVENIKPHQKLVYKAQLLTFTKNYLLLISSLIPELKLEIIIQTLQQYELLQQIKKQLDALQTLSMNNTQLSILSSSMYPNINEQQLQQDNRIVYHMLISISKSIFDHLTDFQINRDIYTVLPSCLNFVDDLLSELVQSKGQAKGRVSEESIEVMLECLGDFLVRAGNWYFQDKKKTEIILKVITTVYSCQIDRQLISYGRFLLCVIKCQKFCCLSTETIQHTLTEIITLPQQSQSQSLIQIQILEELLLRAHNTSSIHHTITSSYLSIFFTSFYQIILKGKYVLEYIQDYAKILFILKQYMYRMNITIENGSQGWPAVVELMRGVHRNIFGEGIGVQRAEDILGVLGNKETSEGEVKKMLRDILVILKRGY